MPEAQPGPCWHDLDRGSFVGYWPHAHPSHAEWFQQLLHTIPWKQHDVVIFGKRYEALMIWRDPPLHRWPHHKFHHHMQGQRPKTMRSECAESVTPGQTRAPCVPGKPQIDPGSIQGYNPECPSAPLVQSLRAPSLPSLRIPQPRLVAYYATDPGALGPYTYSGLTLHPAPFSEVPGLQQAMELVEGLAGLHGAPEGLHGDQTGLHGAPEGLHGFQADMHGTHQAWLHGPHHTDLHGAQAGHLHGSHGGFNTCLMNLYRDGADNVAWHADNEKL